MDPQYWGIIGAIIGTAIGATTSIITTTINNSKSIKLQSNVEEFKRIEKFNEFQVKNLLELQEELTNELRLVGKVHMEDVALYEKNGKWMMENISSELDEQVSFSFRRQIILRERIDNADLREKLIQYGVKFYDCLYASDLDSRNEKMQELTSEFSILMPQLGNVLRSYY